MDQLRPIPKEREEIIMLKFRLDWNYHSNNLEGNSLTFGETKALILFGITAQGKPLKDHFEKGRRKREILEKLKTFKGYKPEFSEDAIYKEIERMHNEDKTLKVEKLHTNDSVFLYSVKNN